MRGNGHDHDWQYTGEKKDDDGKWYTKWACSCRAYKIVLIKIVADESATYDGGDQR